jgi:hypothetical protein
VGRMLGEEPAAGGVDGSEHEPNLGRCRAFL